MSRLKRKASINLKGKSVRLEFDNTSLNHVICQENQKNQKKSKKKQTTTTTYNLLA